MNSTIDERLEDVFRTIFNDDDIVLSNDMTAADIDGWDSVAHINLMMTIEQTFGIQFTGNELAELKNISQLKDCLAKKGCL